MGGEAKARVVIKEVSSPKEEALASPHRHPHEFLPKLALAPRPKQKGKAVAKEVLVDKKEEFQKLKKELKASHPHKKRKLMMARQLQERDNIETLFE